MRKSINNLCKNGYGRGVKKVFACLLSLSMIPISGVAVFADNASTIVQQQEAKQITFAKDSLTATVGRFQKFRFDNIDINDISNVTYTIADESILKIQSTSYYDQTTGYESHSSEYIPEGQKAGETTVTAKITKRDGTIITVGPEKFTVKEQEDPNVVPLKSWGLYNAMEDENYQSVDTNKNGQLEKDEVKNIKKVEFSEIKGSRNFTSDELSFLSDATECTRLNLNADSVLTNIDFAKNMRKLKSVELSGTNLTTLGKVLDDVKDQIEYLGLYGTKIPLSERSSYIKTNEINIVEASKKINFIKPEGLIGANDIDNITIGNDELVSCGLEYDRDFYLKAAKDTVGKSTDLEIKDGDTVKKIKINIKAKDDTIPSLAETFMTTSMSCFPKIKYKNMDDNTWVEMTSKDTSVVKIADDSDPWDDEDRSMGSKYLEPQSVGTSEISVQFHRNGETYDDTLKVEVKPIENGVIPLTSYAAYFGLLDKDHNHVDKNKDYKIDENEIKDVNTIYTHNSDMTNESLAGLEKAINCTSFSTNCKGITNIDLLKNFPKLNKVDLAFSGVTDISLLKGIKDQLTEIYLGGLKVPATERFEFVKTKEITLPEGGKLVKPVEPYGVITYEDTVKIEDENVAVMTDEYTEDDGEREVLVAKGKIGDTTKLVVTNGSDKIEIPIRIVAKSETKDPVKPIQPSSEKPTPAKPSEEKPQTPSQQPTTTAPKKVEKITVTAPSNKLTSNKKVKLTANISNDASNKNIKWTTSNKKYATVDKNGVVKFNKKAAGKTVIITAMATDGSGKKATFKIKIMKGSVQKITISGAKSVKAGKTLKLNAKVKASKGANKKLTWTSSNTKYATVSSSGKVKALKAGKKKSVKITAMATDGSDKKATVTIKIK